MEQSPAQQVVDGLAFPNGMAMSADNRTLIVAESYAKRLTAYDVGGDGGLSNRRVWADLGDGVPDGICIDADGAVWYSDVPQALRPRRRRRGNPRHGQPRPRLCRVCARRPRSPNPLHDRDRMNGPAHMFRGPRTSQIVTIEASAPAAGWP
jgi:sugar lactone lactonase YvrE